MKHTKADLELFAARIRPHFEPELRDVAYELALRISKIVGAKVKELRPETPMAEIEHWMNAAESPTDSLDSVELIMAMEEEFGIGESGDAPRGRRPRTFRDLVVERARQRS